MRIIHLGDDNRTVRVVIGLTIPVPVVMPGARQEIAPAIVLLMVPIRILLTLTIIVHTRLVITARRQE